MLNPSKSKLPVLSFLVFLLTLVINYTANSGFFGQTQKEVSNMYRSFITPEPFTFSIWGVIYVLVAIALIYQLYLRYKKNEYPSNMHRFNVLFILTTVFNILWNIAWVRDGILVSTIFIFIFAILLAMINTELKNKDLQGLQKIFPVAFSIYAGWLTVASVTNVGALLVKYNWNMFGLDEHIVTIFTYFAVAAIAFFIVSNIKNPLFNLPIIWAFIGIRSTLVDNPPGQVHHLMEYAIYIVIVLLVVEMIYVYIKNDKSLLPPEQKVYS